MFRAYTYPFTNYYFFYTRYTNLRVTMSTQDNTFIRVSKDTREKLAAIGSKRETYNEIVRRLLLEKEGSNISELSPSESKRSSTVVV